MGRMKEKAAQRADFAALKETAPGIYPATEGLLVPSKCISHSGGGDFSEPPQRWVLPANWLEPDPRSRSVHGFARTIALLGGMVSATEFVAPWVPICEKPVRIGRTSRGNARQRSISVAAVLPCRKCPSCREIAVRKLRGSAAVEIAACAAMNRQSWFVTLTFSPIHLAGILAQVPPGLSREARTRAIDRVAYRHVDRWLKRLRVGAANCENSRSGPRTWAPARFRYMSVFELGEKSGRAHYHILIHELGPKPIQARQLTETWPSHANAKLVRPGDPGLGKYLTKYLTKGSSGRVRRSKNYGDGPSDSRASASRRSAPGRASDR